MINDKKLIFSTDRALFASVAFKPYRLAWKNHNAKMQGSPSICVSLIPSRAE